MAQNMTDHEIIPIRILSFLAEDHDRLGRFLAITGLEGQDIRNAAAQPGFFLAVVDYVMQDEAALQVFCANEGLNPSLIAKVRQRLAGRPDPAGRTKTHHGHDGFDGGFDGGFDDGWG
jgi:hypothetical protein